MNETKENILLTALRLFARDGYEAVSVSQISGELGMAKSALYKHYKNKRDIFDSIVARMNQMDEQRVKAYQMPEGGYPKIANEYRTLPLDQIKAYTHAMFRHWTEEEFSSSFRKLLTLEQYRNEEMGQLYQYYLSSGPIEAMEELFTQMTGSKEKGKKLAVDFYAPIYLMYSLYDGAKDKERISKLLDEHIDRFSEKMKF